VEAIVYLSEVNTVNGVIIGSETWNTTSLSNVFELTDSVYSNGGCQIYDNAVGHAPWIPGSFIKMQKRNVMMLN
jgi:hypothetical protein